MKASGATDPEDFAWEEMVTKRSCRVESSVVGDVRGVFDGEVEGRGCLEEGGRETEGGGGEVGVPLEYDRFPPAKPR